MRRLANQAGTVALMGSLAFSFSACQTTGEDTAGDASTGSEFQQAEVDTAPVDTTPIREFGTVYFAYDKSDLDADGRTILKNDAGLMQQAKGSVVVQGYTDERGTWEYNLALGERRATSVKSYLVNLGVPGSQLRTVSYGEADPAVAGNNESAWRFNRRVTFKAE